MLTIIGAMLGALFGGFAGLLIGGLLGYAANFALRQFIFGSLQVAQSQLLDSTFSVMGALCKADNVVTRGEINAVEQILNMHKLQGESRGQPKAPFTRRNQAEFARDAPASPVASAARSV